MNPETHIVIERIFEDDLEHVFEAFTTPEIIEKWWGPGGMKTTVDEFHFENGGKWQYTMQTPDGKAFSLGGVFSEIDAPNRYVSEEYWEGMHIEEKGRSLIFQFEKISEKQTKFTFTIIHADKAQRDDHFNKGVVMGWNLNFDNLDQYIS